MNAPQSATSSAREVEFTVQGRTIRLETGRIARQAHGSVLVRQGEAAVLVTAVGAGEERPADFFPLTVEYREKIAASGRIPGSFMRREGRIADHEVLASRIIDRSIRPLFPKGYRRDVQVQATVLSADVKSAETAVLGLIGAGAALALSPLPWRGPLLGIRVARVQGKVVAFPTAAERRRAEVDLVLSLTPEGLVMAEGGAREVGEGEVLDLLEQARSLIQPGFEAVGQLVEQAGRPKVEFAPRPPARSLEHWAGRWEAAARGPLEQALATPGKHARSEALRAAVQAQARAGAREAAADFGAEVDVEGLAAEQLRSYATALVRRAVLESGRRVDGRRLDEVRAIDCQVGWLGSPHGSALFTRGETQAMVTCTLASKQSEQMVETLAGMEARRFLLHYNFPPYSVGETRPLRGPGRREIGHGALAHRSLEPVLPSAKEFPYVVRVESDISESNGSSSMATVCGGCLALMDAGVPISRPVAGIAMGLISDGERFQVLSDILGDEDHLGDMDFKVAGTEAGITALQMDNKIGSLGREVLERALEQARQGRLHILGEMARALKTPRSTPKEHAPRAVSLRISTPAIPDLVGPRGATIREIQSRFDVQVVIDEAAGRAEVHARDASKARQAVRRVKELAGVVEEGCLYRGKVTSVKEFGAFVQIFRSAEGLVHISEWDRGPVGEMHKVVKEGDPVVVRVLGADERGRLRLSRQAALDRGAESIENE